MKVKALVLCAFAVSSYATTFGLAASNQVAQNEETLFFDSPEQQAVVTEAAAAEAAATEAATTEEVTVPVETTATVVTNEEAVFGEPVETTEASTEVIEETFPVETETVEEVPVETTTVVANEESTFVEPVDTVVVQETFPVETAPVEQPAVVSEEEVFQETFPVETAPVEQTTVVSEEEVFQETFPVETAPVEQTIVVSEEEAFPEPIVIAPAPVYEEEVFPEPIVISPAPVYEEEAFPVFEDTAITEEEVFPTIGGGEPLAGGWTDVDLTTVVGDQQIQAILDLGVETLLDTTKDQGNLPETETPYRISQINQIQTQVVAGMNYYCDVDLSNDAGIKISATFTVFSQPWTNTLRVTDGCVTIKKLVKY